MAEESLGWWSALVVAFGLNAKLQATLIRIAWVVIVTINMACGMGFLAFIGLNGYARADDVTQMRHTQEITAQITIGAELGKAISAKCREPDDAKREEWRQYIERLQIEYQALTKSRYPDRCR